MITPRQIRAARGLLGWEAIELGKHTNLSRETIANIESGRTQAREGSLERITKAFELAGVDFIDNEGVRLKSNDIETFVGIDRFQVFTEYLYSHLKQYGGEVCVSVTDERMFQKYRKDIELHRLRMKDLIENHNVTGRILAAEGEFKETWAKIRRMPISAQNNPVSFYAFGKCLALISFSHEPPPYVVLHKSGPFAEAFRQSFNLAWESAEAL